MSLVAAPSATVAPAVCAAAVCTAAVAAFGRGAGDDAVVRQPVAAGKITPGLSHPLRARPDQRVNNRTGKQNAGQQEISNRLKRQSGLRSLTVSIRAMS